MLCRGLLLTKCEKKDHLEFLDLLYMNEFPMVKT